MRCSSFGSHLNLSCSQSRCLWFTDHYASRRTCPSVLPAGASASIPIRPRLSSPSFQRAAAAWMCRGACLGRFSPFFRPGNLCQEGKGQDVPPPQTSEHQCPSPTGARSQQPSAPRFTARGFSGWAFGQRQTHSPCRAGSVRFLLRNLFPYLYVRGMGLVASSKTASVYSVN